MTYAADLHLFSEHTPEGRRTIEPECPARYQRALDRASDMDRLYFVAHPDAGEYIRRYRPGEFFPIMPTNVRRVRVSQLIPGCRMRSPIIEGVR